jgi:carboxyl-terminal processing protease
MVARGAWMSGGVLGAAGVCIWLSHPHAIKQAQPAPSAPAPESRAPPGDSTPPGGDDVCTRSHDFRIPAGGTPSLACEAARSIVRQARTQLGYAPSAVEPRSFAEATADWLDPYGLWSVAPDTPIGESFDRGASALLADLEGRASGDCREARALGVALVGWVTELRAAFDEARRGDSSGEDAMTAASSPAFEGATVTRPARALAATLGRRIGVLDRSMGPAARPYADAARARYFPTLDAQGWSGVVLAAAVRAYVPAVDPHGAWAPLDEESSVYEVDLEARPPSRLWEKADRTAIGIKIESGATPPLLDGDVVLALGGVAAAGLSYEQVEQLGYAVSEARPPARAEILREGDPMPQTTWLDAAAAGSKGSDPSSESDDDLPVERIEYGEQDAIIVAVHDVRDDLGDELTRSILRERERKGPRAVAGVVLDLRGNGGGSTDGAIDALGLFIPGAPLFPMRRRDGSTETDRAPEPPGVDRWKGPVATLVDGDTASAAEMLAGALAAYHRGPVIGARTFGKGCAQEYLDDDAHVGVLRLTTLLYALPDGTPVQRVGLTPTLRFPFGTAEPNDREASLPHAPPLWRGPDVRDRGVLAHAEDGTWSAVWPTHGGNVGPCRDADVCRALRLLGTAASTARRTTPPKGR